jgi:O-antigen/teichoic acid export membrane protein
MDEGGKASAEPVQYDPIDQVTDELLPGTGGSTHRLVRLARKAGWNVVDQVLSALTNAVLFFVVARTVDVAGLDAFATAFYVFSLLIGIDRALVGQVFGITFSASSGQPWRDAVSRGLGTALSVTVLAAAVMAGVGFTVEGALGDTLLATAVVLPALVMQDACRMAFFAHSQAKLAAANDALWAVIQFTAIGILIATDRASTPTLVLAWGGAAAVCVLVALVQLRVRPRPLAALDWFRQTRSLSGFLLAEYLLGAGAFNGGFLVVGMIVGEGAVSSLRGAQVLLGPLGILSAALLSFALPELSRRTSMSSSARWRVAAATTGLMTAVSLAYTGALELLPDQAGTALFGDSWVGASSVLLPVALGSTAAGASLGPAVVIYAMGRARATFRLMAVEAPLVFVLMMIGARIDGARGAAWGLALDQTLLVPLWFAQLRSILRHSGESNPDAPSSRDNASH